MKYTVAAIILFLTTSMASPAVMHAHTQQHLSKERTEDGAYSPRDKGHITDSGEHHSEFDHEAILGSVKDAEEFDHLSPEESKRRLGILLTKMDLNNDREIDRNELHAWILRSFRMLSEEEARDRFEDADENDDGIVTWAEYISDTYGIDENDNVISYETREDDMLIEDDKEMFKAADANKDEVLDINEFIVFSHPEEHPTMLPIILEQTLRDKDTNKDGEINFQEFVGEKAVEKDKEWLITEKEKFDEEFDKNHDGKLTGNEILSWVVPSNDEIALEEVDHLFASTDEDHSNVLSFDEILNNHETFVGSEATDFGDHLHNIHHFEDEL